MPPSEETQEESSASPLLSILFWAGVGLSPIAALILLIGGGEGSLRIGAVFVVICVVLIGLSIGLRKDATAVRADIEDTLFDEMDALREDFRKDITTAARATHRQFSEKLQTLYQSV